eukprot:4036819-Alexandrium_andersonii.AAC.1
MDLGVTQEALGNVFFEAVESLCVGRNREARLMQLWVMMKQHYKEAKTPCQLQGLTMEMVKRDTKGPKLRAKGGETRHL